MKRRLFSSLLLLVLFTACSNTNSVAPPLLPPSTPQPSAKISTFTPNSIIQDITPTYPPLPATTQDFLEGTQQVKDSEAILSKVNPCKESHFPMTVDFSPDGRWLAVYCDDKNGNLTLITDEQIFWKVTDDGLFGLTGYLLFKPVRWSTNGTRLYFETSHPFYNAILPQTPSVPLCFNPDAVTLIGLDLQTGKTDFILGDRDSYRQDELLGYAYAFSASENFLASSLQNRSHIPEVAIQNLSDGTERILQLSGEEVNTVIEGIVWNSTETRLALKVTNCETLAEKVILLDSASGQVEQVSHNLPEGYYLSGWPYENLLLLYEPDSGYYYFDLVYTKIVGPIQ